MMHMRAGHETREAQKRKKYLLFSSTSVTIASVGDIAQLGEHPLDVRKVTGSNPVISTETAQQSGFFVQFFPVFKKS